MKLGKYLIIVLTLNHPIHLVECLLKFKMYSYLDR